MSDTTIQNDTNEITQTEKLEKLSRLIPWADWAQIQGLVETTVIDALIAEKEKEVLLDSGTGE